MIKFNRLSYSPEMVVQYITFLVLIGCGIINVVLSFQLVCALTFMYLSEQCDEFYNRKLLILLHFIS